VAIGGDGDLMFTPGALWTAAHHRIPLLYVVHNNRAYHQEVMYIQMMAAKRQRGITRAHIGNTITDPKLNAIDVIGDSPILTDNQVVRPHALALRVTDYAQPGGQSVRAHPALQGNNFRANTVGTVPLGPTTASVGRP